jgi:imidazolonepropionase-like amidohydrolase
MLSVTQPASSQTIAITGGRVFPVSGAPIDNGTVLIRNGKIAAVGANVNIPADAQRIDATGKWVTPGFTNPHTQVGLGDVGFSGPTSEQSANGQNGIAASFTTWNGFNPMSVNVAQARNDGVTTVLSVPQGGLIAGQAAFMELAPGVTTDAMLLKAPAAMIGEIGSAGQANLGSKGELIDRLRTLFEDVRFYARHRTDFDRAQTRSFFATRADLEAMIPVVEGRLPFMVTVDRASDIHEALKLAHDYGLRLIILSGAEAWMVADELAAAKVPVLPGAYNNIPQSFDQLGSREDNAALLRKAGVTVAISGGSGSDEQNFNVGNVRYEAGSAVANGMSWDDALRGVTLVPAEIFGAADRVGSLQAGRDANVVVWSGDPFEFSSRAEHVFIRGKDISGEQTRRDLLEQRYKSLPPSYISTP